MVRWARVVVRARRPSRRWRRFGTGRRRRYLGGGRRFGVVVGLRLGRRGGLAPGGSRRRGSLPPGRRPSGFAPFRSAAFRRALNRSAPYRFEPLMSSRSRCVPVSVAPARAVWASPIGASLSWASVRRPRIVSEACTSVAGRRRASRCPFDRAGSWACSRAKAARISIGGGERAEDEHHQGDPSAAQLGELGGPRSGRWWRPARAGESDNERGDAGQRQQSQDQQQEGGEPPLPA